MIPDLVAQDLTVHLGGRTVLDRVRFTLKGGGLHGLIGPNGAGKTTLLRALAGLVPLRTGSVQLDGQDTAQLDRQERARTFGYLPQNGTCHWPLPVERLVELGRIPHLARDEHPTAGDRNAVEEALRVTDTLALRERPVTELSGGERARVFLARVLAGEPRVLLVDEPLAGLDLFHQFQVMELLRTTACASGRMAAVVMHDLSLALRYCSMLTLLDGGKTPWTGTPAELLRSELPARVFRVELQALDTASGPVLVPAHRRSD